MRKYTSYNSNLFDVSILRTFSVISVVLWHSYCPYICWGIADSPLNRYYTFILSNVLPDANLPLFTFISGYLFRFSIEKNKYSEFIPFLYNKVNRLLIPFIVLGSVINLCEIDKNIVDILYGKPNHLWYCLMLFYCFILCWFIEKKIRNYNIILAIISAIFASYIGGGVLSINSPLGIVLPIYYYVYFYFGFYVYKCKNKVYTLMTKCWSIILIVYISFCIYNPGGHLIVFQCLSYILLLWRIVNSRKIISICLMPPISNFIYKINKYSFGIYVFHQWIIWNLTRSNFILPIISEYYIMFPALLFIIVIVLSYSMTWILTNNNRVFRYLLT